MFQFSCRFALLKSIFIVQTGHRK